MTVEDPANDESFRRVVGTRARPALGEIPSAARREALAELARYTTGAPKGVFRYRSHEEANAHRDAWTLARLCSASK